MARISKKQLQLQVHHAIGCGFDELSGVPIMRTLRELEDDDYPIVWRNIIFDEDECF